MDTELTDSRGFQTRILYGGSGIAKICGFFACRSSVQGVDSLAAFGGPSSLSEYWFVFGCARGIV
jgi:hypothetical protein